MEEMGTSTDALAPGDKEEVVAPDKVEATPTPDEVEATPTPDEVEATPTPDEAEKITTPEIETAAEKAAADQQWEELDDGEGNTYFYNHKTGVSQWERPFLLLSALAAFKTAERDRENKADTDTVAAEPVEDPEWEEIDNGEGNKYYY